nr:PREDICTED: facilitated trehalose transporter Tret1-like isoform X1 [Bemisia tabaci]
MRIKKEEDPETLTWSCWFRTLFAGSAALVLYVFIGINEGLSAVMLAQFKKRDSFIRVSEDQETWVASLGIVTAPIGAILIGPFVDAFGRKVGILIFYLTIGSGFGVIALSMDVTQIYIGRIICAFCEGFKACAVVYIAEICTPTQRSLFLSAISTMFSGGVLICTVMSAFVSWNSACLAYSLAAFAFAGVQWFVPESPGWLYRHGREDEALRSLERLGRSKADVLREMDDLKERKSNQEKLELKSFFEPIVWKPFVILSTFHVLQFSTGIYDIIYYQVDFIQSLGTTYDPMTVSVAMSTIRFLSNATIGVYAKSVSRKGSTALCGLGMALTLLATGAYELAYRDTEIPARPYQWLPISLILSCIVASNLSVTCLPWAMSGEMYPLRVRGIMSGATLVVAYFAFFFYIKMYYVFLEALKIYGVLFVFAACSVVVLLFGIFVLPETQGKSLLEVELGFEKKAKRSENVENQNGKVEKGEKSDFVTRF